MTIVTKGTVIVAPPTYHSVVGAMTDAPTGCPVRDDWSPLGPAYLADPYPIARRLADETPIFFDPALGCVVVSRRADIDAVFVDHETFASSNVQDPIVGLSADAASVLAASDFDPVAVMSNRAEPDHGRIRVHTSAGFSNRRLATMAPFIRSRTEELVGDFLAAGSPTEIVGALAFPLPGETVFRFIGFPPEDDDLLKAWCQDRKLFSWGLPSPTEQVDLAGHMVAYWRYCRDFVAQRRRSPADDFTSELLAVHAEDPTELSYREVESIVYGLSFAGHEAVTALLCNTLVCLLRHREQWEAVCNDPSLAPAAVEEVLRYESSQISWRRVTTRTTVLNGVELAPGTPILLNFAAANRQPDLFEDAEHFDITRPDARRHISFGKGVHYCLGARLARMEATIVLEVLTQRAPTLRLPAQDITWSPNITFRGPRRLVVAWSTTGEGTVR